MALLVLTRTEADNGRITPLFERQGFAVRSAPMIELRPIPKDACGVRQVRRLAEGTPVVLTSAFATELWLDLRETDFADHPPRCYYVVGETSRALLAEGDPDVPIAAVANSAEDLLRCDFAGTSRVLYPCSNDRRDTLVEGLRQCGVEVIDMPLYYPARPADAAAALAAALAGETPDAEHPLIVAFFSPSAVHNFVTTPGVPALDAAGICAAAIGATTAEALRACGAAWVIVAEEPSAASLAGTLAAAFA